MKVKGWIKLLLSLLVISGLVFLAVKGPVIYEKNEVVDEATGETKIENGDVKISFGANKLVGKNEFGEKKQFILKPVLDVQDDLPEGVVQHAGDANATIDELKLSKRIMEERLKKVNVKEFDILIDELNNKLIVETENDDEIENLISTYVTKKGNLKFTDSQGKAILEKIDIARIESSLETNPTDATHEWYVTFYLTKEGQEKFAKASEEIAAMEPYTFNLEDGTPYQYPQNYISLRLDGTVLQSVTVSEKMDTETLMLTAGNNVSAANKLSSLLNLELLPYNFDVESSGLLNIKYPISMAEITLYTVGIILLVILLIVLFKYRLAGLVTVLSLIVFGTLEIVTLSMGQVKLDMAGIFGILAGLSILVAVLVNILNNLSKDMKIGKSLKVALKDSYDEVMINFAGTFVVTVIISIVLQLFATAEFRSFGVLFGSAMVIAYVALFFNKFILNQFYAIGLKNEGFYTSKRKKSN